MRVLLLTDVVPDLARGGLDLHVKELGQALHSAGVEVITHAINGDGSDTPSPVEELAKHIAAPGNDALLERFNALLAEHEPDVVHIHSLQGISHRLPEQAVRFGARVMWTLHDFYSICPRTHLHDGDGNPCAGPQLGAACGPCYGGIRGLLAAPVFGLRYAGYLGALHRCEKLIVPSRYVGEVLLEQGLLQRQIEILPPAVPRPSRLAELAEDSGCRFVFAGDLREAKGADLAVEAMAEVRELPVSLDVYGGAPAPPAPREIHFEERLSESAKGSAVSFYGRYEPDRLLSILDGAAALLVPSRVRESFGRTANLALQAGIPVIAARHGALPDFVHDGINGSLFEAGDSASLAASMRTVFESGLDMQADMDSWPAVPSLEEHTSRVLELYGSSP